MREIKDKNKLVNLREKNSKMEQKNRINVHCCWAQHIGNEKTVKDSVCKI